jgi:hypothetical protein
MYKHIHIHTYICIFSILQKIDLSGSKHPVDSIGASRFGYSNMGQMFHFYWEADYGRDNGTQVINLCMYVCIYTHTCLLLYEYRMYRDTFIFAYLLYVCLLLIGYYFLFIFFRFYSKKKYTQ